MKAYYIIIDDRMGGDSLLEFYPSIKKAQKARARHRRNKDLYPSGTIFKCEWKPTKKGFINYLNFFGAGIPVEGA